MMNKPPLRGRWRYWLLALVIGALIWLALVELALHIV